MTHVSLRRLLLSSDAFQKWSIYKNIGYVFIQPPPPIMFLKALNLLCSLQLCCQIFWAYHLAEQSLGGGPISVWGGWMLWLNGLSHHWISHLIHPLCKAVQECCYLLCCFGGGVLTLAVLWGNSRTSPVFILLLLLEIQQRNISLNYASFKWTDCLLSYVYAHLFLLLSSTCNNLILLIFGSLYNYSTMRFRFWKQLSKQDGKSFPGISVKVTSNPVTTVPKTFHVLPS